MPKFQAIVLCVGLSALSAAPCAALAEATGARHHKHSAHGHAPNAARQGAAGAIQGSRQIYMAPAVGVPPIGSTTPEAPVNTLPAGQAAPICGAGPYPACH